jgi:hypothetical protein
MTNKNLPRSLFIIIAVLMTNGNAHSYHYKTHALSAKLAAELVKRLDAAKKRYTEIYDPSLIAQLGVGAWEEDNGNFAGNNRAMRHYYDPDFNGKKKGVPYYKHYTWWRTLEKGTDVTKPSGGRYAGALEWARNGAVENWNITNPFNWEGAINAYDYTHSSRSEAYYRLGHVLHLLTDMAEPDHVFNMPHAGSSKGLPDTIDEIIGQSMADAVIEDLKSIRVSDGSKDKLAWLLFATRIKQMAFKSRRLGYELLVDDSIHPKFVSEFFKGKDEIHLIESKTTWDTLPPIQGKHLPELNKFDDFFNSLARWSKLAVSNKNKYPIPLGLVELSTYFPHKEMLYPREPIYLIPAIDMSVDTEKQKYYALAWELLEKATEYNANLLMHFYDIVNPPPYVKEVTVSQDGKVKYQAYWEDEYGQPEGNLNANDPHSNYNIVKKRELKNMANRGLMHEKKATIKIKFGPEVGVPENIDKNSVKVTIGGKSIPGSIKSDEEPNIWQGTFPVPKLKEDEDEKTLQISISASDADMHWTVGPIPGSTLDSDPYSPAKVYYRGPGKFQWMNHESATAGEKWDTNHQIKIVKEEEVLPFEFYFTSVTKGTAYPYTKDLACYTELRTSKDVWVQLFEKETWVIKRDKPDNSWYSKIVQKDGYYEIFSIYSGQANNLETPAQDKITGYSKSDGDSSELCLFKQDDDEKFLNNLTSMKENRITAFGPQGGSPNEQDESNIVKWRYRGKGKDGKIYVAELVFDFKKEWIVDYKTKNQIVYKRVKEKE